MKAVEREKKIFKKFFKKDFENFDLLKIMLNMFKWNVFLNLHLFRRIGLKFLKKLLYDLSIFLEKDLGFHFFLWIIIKESRSYKAYIFIKEDIVMNVNNLLTCKLNFLLAKLNSNFGVNLKGFIKKLNINLVKSYIKDIENADKVYEFFEFSVGCRSYEILIKKGLKFNVVKFNDLDEKFLKFLSSNKNEFKIILRVSRVEELSKDFLNVFLNLMGVENYFWFSCVYNYHLKTHSRNDTINKYFYYIGIDRKLSNNVIENAWWEVYKVLGMNLREVVKRYKKYVEVDNYMIRFKEIEVYFPESWTSEEFFFFCWKDYKKKNFKKLSMSLEKKYYNQSFS